MHSIPSYIPLALGVIAGSMFILVFLFAVIVTMRNRRKIQRFASMNKENK